MAVNWIQTNSNKVLTPLDLKVEQVGGIEEIAHALAYSFRFNRQLARPYSVAEHCYRGSSILPSVFAGAFLLHELSEVYLPDVPAPVKPFLKVLVEDRLVSWVQLERNHTAVMLEALGLSSIEPLIYSPEVRQMDLAMLAAEKRDLVGPEPEPWGLTVPPANIDVTQPLASKYAERLFVSTFKALFGR